MADIFTRGLKKQNILERVGDISQICDARKKKHIRTGKVQVWMSSMLQQDPDSLSLYFPPADSIFQMRRIKAYLLHGNRPAERWPLNFLSRTVTTGSEVSSEDCLQPAE